MDKMITVCGIVCSTKCVHGSVVVCFAGVLLSIHLALCDKSTHSNQDYFAVARTVVWIPFPGNSILWVLSRDAIGVRKLLFITSTNCILLMCVNDLVYSHFGSNNLVLETVLPTNGCVLCWDHIQQKYFRIWRNYLQLSSIPTRFME